MAPITLISGSPGAGKTTVSRLLAAGPATGVHLVTDRFFRCLAHPIEPSRAEAHEQNRTVVRAYLRAAVAFAEGGYHVFVDGVVGPWMLDIVLAEAEGIPIDYAVLRADIDSVVGRAAERTIPEAATEDVVRTMHAQFAALGEFEKHVIDTAALTVEEVAEQVRRRAAKGDLRLKGAAFGPAT